MERKRRTLWSAKAGDDAVMKQRTEVSVNYKFVAEVLCQYRRQWSFFYIACPSCVMAAAGVDMLLTLAFLSYPRTFNSQIEISLS